MHRGERARQSLWAAGGGGGGAPGATRGTSRADGTGQNPPGFMWGIYRVTPEGVTNGRDRAGKGRGRTAERDRLIVERHAAGESQSSIARALGLTQQGVSKIVHLQLKPHQVEAPGGSPVPSPSSSLPVLLKNSEIP